MKIYHQKVYLLISWQSIDFSETHIARKLCFSRIWIWDRCPVFLFCFCLSNMWNHHLEPEAKTEAFLVVWKDIEKAKHATDNLLSKTTNRRLNMPWITYSARPHRWYHTDLKCVICVVPAVVNSLSLSSLCHTSFRSLPACGHLNGS